VNAAAQRIALQVDSVVDPSVLRIDRRIRSIALTDDPSRQAPPLQSRCLSPVMHRRSFFSAVYRYQDLNLRGLAGRLVLPSIRPAALLGFLGPSQVCSRMRVAPHLCAAGPTCRSHRFIRPIYFRRGDFTARQEKMRAKLSGKSG